MAVVCEWSEGPTPKNKKKERRTKKTPVKLQTSSLTQVRFLQFTELLRLFCQSRSAYWFIFRQSVTDLNLKKLCVTTLFSVVDLYGTTCSCHKCHIFVSSIVVRTLSQKWDQSLFVVEFILRYSPTVSQENYALIFYPPKSNSKSILILIWFLEF